MTNALGGLTLYSYDYQGRLTRVQHPDGYSVTNVYNLLGQLITSSDGVGSSTNWFNNQGLLVAVSNVLGRVSATIYDADNHATNTFDLNGVSVTQTFDPLGQMVSRIYPDGGVEGFRYSAVGLTVYTNQLTNVTFYGYDAARRKTSETNAVNEVTRFKYEPSGQLTNLVDGKSQNTYWKYDLFGRMTNKVDHLGSNAFVYAYDANDRLTSRWTPAKGTTSYAYDRNGNLTNVNYPTSADLSFEYDALNRMTTMNDAVGTTAFAYDPAGMLESEDGPWSSDTVSYTYANRQRSQLRLEQPNASDWEQTYGYDGARRLTGTASPAGTFGYLYDPTRQSQVRRLVLPSGAYITNTFDAMARMTSTILKNSTNGLLNSHAYGYNVGSQRTNVVRTLGDSVNYSYDNIGQLKTASGFESNGTVRLHEQFGYAYDQAHNLGRKTNNGFVTRYFVDGVNQLTGATNSGKYTVAGTTSGLATNTTVNNSNALLYADATFAQAGITLATGTNTFTARAQDSYGRLDTNTVSAYFAVSNSYAYDANGNLISDGSKGFTYDDENQLIRITATNSWKSEFKYDGKMRRRVRAEYVWRDGAWVLAETVNYVYDGKLVIQERFFVDSYQVQQVSYTRGLDLSGSLQGAGGIGGLLAYTRGIGSVNEHSYYHADGNGNITAMVSPQQVVVARYVYDPFGNTVSSSGPMAEVNSYRFSSQNVHGRSGLTHYFYRHYAPLLARWINRDPIGSLGPLSDFMPAQNLFLGSYAHAMRQGASLISILGFENVPGPDLEGNLYQFVLNNPNMYLDPLGLWYIDINFTFSAIFGGTCGITIGSTGVHVYGGAVLATPGPSASITWSGSNPTPGWNYGLGVTAIGAFQTGNSIPPTPGNSYVEFGLGGPLGGGVAAYHVW